MTRRAITRWSWSTPSRLRELMRTVDARVRSGARPATRRGSYLTLAALAMGASLPAPRHAAAQVSVDEAELFLDPSGSGRRVGSFNVTNEGKDLAQVTIYLSDWDRQENGEHRFVSSGTLPQSCAGHMRLFPQSLRLEAGHRQAVRVEVMTADSLKAACWSIAFVETSALQKGTGRQVTYVTRLGVKIYVLPPGLAKEGEVEDIVKETGDSGRTRIAITFHDVGGLPLWVRGTIEYRRPDNSIAATDTVAEFPVLPGARRRVAVTVPRLPRGTYVALALLDYGGAEIAAGQIAVQLP
jgi:P pilus assembly chaperone PapD